MQTRVMLMVLFVIFAAGTSGARADESVRFGAIFCLTGEIAQGCNAIREGAEVAVDMVNAAGGVKGRRLVLEIQDSGYSPRVANTIGQKYAADPSMLGVVITGIVETKAAGAVLEKAHLPSITLWDSTPEIEALGDYAFGIGPWLPSSYETSATFAVDHLKAKTAVVLSTNSEWSLLVAQGFASRFRKLGGTVLSSSSSPADEADYRTVLLRAISLKPDVLYAPVTAHLTTFFKQAQALKYTGKIITSDNLSEGEMAKNPAVFEGVYQTQVADPETPESKELSALYRKKFGKPAAMLVYHSWGFDGVRLLAEAAARSDLTRESVKEQLFLIKGFRGANGIIELSPEGSWRMPVRMFIVHDAKLVPTESFGEHPGK